MKPSRGQPRATIADVAERAGVSIATVSRVINRSAPVAQETARRVHEAIAALHYVPHLAAQQLASRRTGMLGLVVDEISGEFFSPLIRGIERCAREAGYELLIASTGGRGVSVFGEHNTDGILVFTESLSDEELARLHEAGFPMVLLHRSPPPGLAIPCVTVENKQGARRMTDHLIEQCGHRRIAFLHGPEGSEDSAWREVGYRESLAAHKLLYRPELIAAGEFSVHHARLAVEQWITDGLEIDAIFAADDESAVGALMALRSAGIRVPEQVAVVGFDDLPMVRYLSPPLTTVRAPTERVGCEAARQLIRLIEQGSAEPLVLLPTELIIRESCGYGLRHPPARSTRRR
ncbi:MAG: LacI family DNA-binding transcriptional regulator [Anaerolineae bacterium]